MLPEEKSAKLVRGRVWQLAVVGMFFFFFPFRWFKSLHK